MRSRLSLNAFRSSLTVGRSPCSSRPSSLRQISTKAKRPSAFAFENGPKWSGIPARYIFYVLSCAVGAGVGISANGLMASRFSPPTPDSQEDRFALEQLAQAWEKLDVVKSLRSQGYNLHSDTSLSRSGSGKGGWMELDVKRTITEGPGKGEVITRTLTGGTLTGIRGLGIQRAFWNSETREIVAVVWIGPMLSGWPGVTHGGAIATIFEDAMSRMIAGPDNSIDAISMPTSVSVDYVRPTLSGNTYILRAAFSKPGLTQDAPPPHPEPTSWLPPWKDFTKKSISAGAEPAVEIEGTLEDLEGNVTVKAKGAWPASILTIR